MVPHLTAGQTLERWMGDGTFSSPREHLEWFPRGTVLVYRVAGVQRCPDIVQFASGHGRESFRFCLIAGY